jgi:HD-like signal output (HDOD) protein
VKRIRPTTAKSSASKKPANLLQRLKQWFTTELAVDVPIPAPAIKTRRGQPKSTDEKYLHELPATSISTNAALHEQFLNALVPEAEADISAPQRVILQTLQEQLLNLSNDLPHLPRLPAIMPKLMSALRDVDASQREFSEIIRKDPAIASSVLRLANSVFYGNKAKPVTSIERAVATLGINGLRTLLTAAVMQPVIQVQSPLYAQFGKALWEHSIICAICAEDLAAHQNEDKFKAYLLGLIHDVGAIVVFAQLEYAFREHAILSEPAPAVVVQLLRQQALGLSAKIARIWQLPDDIIAALDEQISGAPPKIILGSILARANELAELHFLMERGAMSEVDVATRLQQMHLPEDFIARLGAVNL